MPVVCRLLLRVLYGDINHFVYSLNCVFLFLQNGGPGKRARFLLDFPSLSSQ